MIVTFLGTSSGAPTTKRNVSAITLWFIQRGKWWLFDCGEGTQHQIMRSHLKLSQLEKIFITHLHGDHVYGLIGMLASRSLRGGALDPITLYGPPGLKPYVEGIMATSPVHLKYPLIIKTIEPGTVFEDEELTVTAAEVAHRIPAYAYAVEEKERAGAFQVELAKAAGIPPGPLYGRLKRGESVVLPDGRTVHGKDFQGAPKQGRKVVFSGDTQPCDELIALSVDADLLIHEATYAHRDVELAVRSAHSTARQAAQVAQKARVQTLFLTHFSPRYENEDGDVSLDDLLNEAREVFPHTYLAHDFLQFECKRKRM